MASSDSGENHRPSKPHNHGAPPPEQQHLLCPRCDSPNTKFCYYNNYNLSQPRHFCKSCRRYWTRGGTLRDVPVGGGSRKNAKRSRTIPAANVTSGSSQDHTVLLPLPVTQGVPVQFGASGGGVDGDNVKGNVNVCGSFTSWLNNGFGLGLGLGLEDVTGFGTGRMGWAFPEMVDGGDIGGGVVASGVGNWRQFENSGGEGGFVGGDCFSWPGLAISTPGNGLK